MVSLCKRKESNKKEKAPNEYVIHVHDACMHLIKSVLIEL